MHIVHGGKLLQLWCLVKICSKTFVVVSFVQHLIDYLYEKFAGKLVAAIVNPWKFKFSTTNDLHNKVPN